jgi:hypothetical protein
MVMSSTMLDLSNGRIVHQSTVQAWDEEAEDRFQTGDFGSPDEQIPLKHGHAEILQIGGQSVVRTTMEPGWTWSEDIREMAGTDLCEMTHNVVLLSGTVRVRMEDGTEQELTAGQAAFIPPRHDAWVVGDETAVAIDWTTVD